MTSQEILIRIGFALSIFINLILLNCLLDANAVLNRWTHHYFAGPRLPKKYPRRNALHRFVLYLLSFPFLRKHSH